MSDDDVTKRAARVINEANWKADFKGGARADEIAQALDAAGLLVTPEQVRAEFEDMEHRLSVLLCNLTGGLLSKTGYDVATMEQHIEDYFEREVVEPARAEVRAATLAGFTEERKDICGNCGRSPCYARCRQRMPNPQQRLVSPWEPAP